MVRARFSQTLEHAYEDLKAAVGDEVFRLLGELFFAEAPPRSPYLRDVPGEFLRFFEARWGELAERHALAPFTLISARYEWALLDAAYAPAKADEVVPFDMERPPALSSSVRLLSLAFPVQRWNAGDAPPAPSPVSLCVYRDPRSFEVETLELTDFGDGHFARGAGERALLTELVKTSAREHGALVDTPFVEALSELLADLTERGVLVGSLANPEK